MSLTRSSRENGSLATLRQFMRPPAPLEHCDLCSLALAHEHQHLLEPLGRQLLCCCDPCAILFSGAQGAKYRRVPRRVRFLPEFRLTDAQWEGLYIPIGLAFILQTTSSERAVAFYPSPAGAVESLLTLEAWRELVQENPILQDLETDVEALLVNRVGQTRECFCVPIDECYKLVGVLRANWRGLSGGSEVWDEIGRFFTRLKEKSSPPGGGSHA